MVVITLPNDKKFYIDGKLYEQLQKVKKKVKKKDSDRVIIVDGEERVGKSVLAMQMGATLDPTLCLERVCFSPEEFKETVHKAEKGQVVIFDEAFRGLSNRATLSEVNRLLVEMMMEMGQKNLFIFVVLPTFFLLDKYVALWRATDLFHVYFKGDKRGYWVYFNKKKKKLLYLYGRKEFNYIGKNIPKSGFRGRFLEQYIIDETKYREKKRRSLKRRRGTKEEKFHEQRNKIICGVKEDFNISTSKDLSEWLKKHEVTISPEQLRKILSKIGN